MAETIAFLPEGLEGKQRKWNPFIGARPAYKVRPCEMLCLLPRFQTAAASQTAIPMRITAQTHLGTTFFYLKRTGEKKIFTFHICYET